MAYNTVLPEATLRKKLLECTSLYETSLAPPDNYGVTAGNFDGAGMSWGCIQYNFGQTSPNDTLTPKWVRMLNEFLSDCTTAIPNTSDFAYWRDHVVNGTYTEKKTFGTNITDPANSHKVIEPWNTYFKNLGKSIGGQTVQVDGADWYYDTAVTWMDTYDLWSRRGLSLLFDICVQSGSISTATRDLILADFSAMDNTGKTREQIETDKMVIIANRRADAVTSEFQASYRQRKLALANGSGWVYGNTLFMDTTVYDMILEPAFEWGVQAPPQPVIPPTTEIKDTSPIIKSTLCIFNRAEELTAVLEQGSKNSAPYYGAKIKRVLNGEHVLTFKAPYDNDQIKTIEELGYIAIKNKYGQWELFTITEIDHIHGDSLEIEVTAEGSWIELDDIVLTKKVYTSQLPNAVLSDLLVGTRWEVGTVTGFTTTHTKTWQFASILTALQDMKEIYGGEITFAVEISGNKISRRTVSFAPQRGIWKGKRLEWGKDLTEVTRTIDAKSVKTALVGYGNEVSQTDNDTVYWDFSNIEWKVANGDPIDKPLGQNWIGDSTARDTWGKPLAGGTAKQHLVGVFNFGTDDPAELLAETWAQLQIVKNPILTYTAKGLDLYRLLGIQAESVDLGDTVAVLDTDLALTLSARLIEIEEDLDNPDQTDYTLGNFLPNLTDDTDDVYNSIISRIQGQIGNTLKPGDPINPDWIDVAFGFANDEIRVGGGTVIMNEGDGILIVDDPANPQKAIKLQAGQIALANSFNTFTGEFNWQNFGTGEGWLASLIETRKLSFSDAQGGRLILGGRITGYSNELKIETVNWADKSKADGDTSREIFYQGYSASELPYTSVTLEASGGYDGALATNDAQTLYLDISHTNKYKARYIRDYVNGSTANTNAYWNTISVMAGGVDIARGILPTSNGAITNAVNVTDGSDTTYAYVLGPGSFYAQVDLGSVRTDIDSIKILHYYLDGRTFHGVKTQISEDGTNWTTIFDSAVSGEYVETSAGKTYTAPTVGVVGAKVQFVHHYRVDLLDLDSLNFTAVGVAGNPFTIKAWNFTTGAWSTVVTASYDGILDRATIVCTIGLTQIQDHVDTDGDCYFSILSSNSVAANSSMRFDVDFTKLDKNYYVQTTPIFENGKMTVLDKDGEIIADLDGETGGFTNLYVADLECPNVVEFQEYETSYNLYVAEKVGTGIGLPSDDNDGLTWATPLRTITEAIRRVPYYFNGNVFIYLASGHTFYEYAIVKGFGGNGSLTIDGQSLSTKIIGNIDCNRSNIGIYLKNFTINATDSYSCISINNCHCECDTVKLNGVANNGTTYGFDILYRGYGKLTNCEVYSCQRGIRAGYGGTAHLISGNKGYGSVSGLYAQGGNIYGSGTAPGGVANSAITQGGTIATFTYDTGSYVVPVPPEATKVITSSGGSGNWSSGNGWQLDYVKQGNYGYGNRTGAWFFTKSFKDEIGTGKTIKRIRIWISRVSGKGSSASAKHSIRYHTSQSRPSGNVSVSPEIASISLGWGQSGWATVSPSYFTAFANGTAKGIGVYRADGSYYSGLSLTCKVEIVYQ